MGTISAYGSRDYQSKFNIDIEIFRHAVNQNVLSKLKRHQTPNTTTRTHLMKPMKERHLKHFLTFKGLSIERICISLHDSLSFVECHQVQGMRNKGEESCLRCEVPCCRPGTVWCCLRALASSSSSSSTFILPLASTRPPWPPIGASGSTGRRGPAQNKPDLGKSNLTIVLCKLLPGAAHEKWSRNKLVPRIVQRLSTWDPYNDKGALWRLHVINLLWTKASFLRHWTC